MKFLLTVCLCFVAAQCVQAQQNQPPQAAGDQQTTQSQAPQGAGPGTMASQANVDPVKAADIQHLLEVAGTKAMLDQTLTAMETNLKPNMIRSLPPGDYRDKVVDLFFEKFHSKLNLQQFLDMAAAAYDKYLSDEDIRGLIQFYQTPLGQKALTVLPKLTIELQTEGMQLGQQIGRESMAEVLREHPDLATALQQATHRPSQPPQQ